MAGIEAFKGILYNKDKAGELSGVVAPPYDVISDEEREKLYAGSDWNIVRVILGKELPGDGAGENRYTRAKDYLNEWLDSHILARDDQPAIYLLEQEYNLPDGSRNMRKGFICLVKLEDYKYVLPHESTLSGPKEDRLNLFKACYSNFSPIFTFYSDPARSADKIIAGKEESSPDVLLEDYKGVREALWKITEKELIENLSAIMKEKPLFIADGHHRYATALNYQAQMKAANPAHTGSEPYNYTMVYFTNMDDEGLTIFPTHRMVRNIAGFAKGVFMEKLQSYFDILPCSGSELEGKLQESGDNRDMGMCFKDDYYILKLKNGNVLESIVKTRSQAYCRLNVAVLHELVINRILNASEDTFENIVYSKSSDEVMEKVNNEEFHVGFFLQPIGLGELRAVVEARELMPRKATYFYPKLTSGMVINKIK